MNTFTSSHLSDLAPFTATGRKRGTWSATTAAALMGGQFNGGQELADKRNGVAPDAKPRTATGRMSTVDGARSNLPRQGGVQETLPTIDAEAPTPGEVVAPQWVPDAPTLGDFVAAAQAHGATAILVETQDGAVYDTMTAEIAQVTDTEAVSEGVVAVDTAIVAEPGSLAAVDPDHQEEPVAPVAPVKPSRYAAAGKRGQRVGPSVGEITLAGARERLAQVKSAAYPAEHLVGLWAAKVAELEAAQGVQS